MQHAKIARTQHPVGHGGFHSGLISTVEGSPTACALPMSAPSQAFPMSVIAARNEATLSTVKCRSTGQHPTERRMCFLFHIFMLTSLTASIVCRRWCQRRLSSFLHGVVERLLSCFPSFSAVRYPDRRLTTSRAPEPGGSGEMRSGSSSFSRAGLTISPSAWRGTRRSDRRPVRWTPDTT